MAPSNGGVRRKRFVIDCPRKPILAMGITRAAGFAGARIQGRLIVNVEYHPPVERAARKRKKSARRRVRRTR